MRKLLLGQLIFLLKLRWPAYKIRGLSGERAARVFNSLGPEMVALRWCIGMLRFGSASVFVWFDRCLGLLNWLTLVPFRLNMALGDIFAKGHDKGASATNLINAFLLQLVDLCGQLSRCEIALSQLT